MLVVVSLMQVLCALPQIWPAVALVVEEICLCLAFLLFVSLVAATALPPCLIANVLRYTRVFLLLPLLLLVHVDARCNTHAAGALLMGLPLVLSAFARQLLQGDQTFTAPRTHACECAPLLYVPGTYSCRPDPKYWVTCQSCSCGSGSDSRSCGCDSVHASEPVSQSPKVLAVDWHTSASLHGEWLLMEKNLVAYVCLHQGEASAGRLAVGPIGCWWRESVC
jgi:hypothetical protein